MNSWHSAFWCQEVRKRIVSVLLVVGAVFCGAFFIAPQPALAQGTCGYFYQPFNVSSIQDCTNPFGVDSDFSYAASITLDGQELAEGGTITVEPGASNFALDVAIDPFYADVILYQHILNGYRQIGVARYNADTSVTLTDTGTYSAFLYMDDFSSKKPYDKKLITFTVEVEGSQPNFSNPPSILFLPGIQASRLYEHDSFADERRWEPGGNHDARRLAMTPEGKSENDIYTDDVVDEAAFGIYDFYVGFLDHLEHMKTDGDISDWGTFAYDWRYSVLDVVKNGTQYEKWRRFPTREVEQLAYQNDSPVTLIAHSNGGLLAKGLVDALEGQRKEYLVDQIIFIGTPQTGTPKSIGSMLHGYDQEMGYGFILDDEVARDVIKNLPGAYGLIPTTAYLSQTNDPVVTFADKPELSEYQDAYGDSISMTNDLRDFLTGVGTGRDEAHSIEEPVRLNADMLAQAGEDHADVLSDWTAPDHIDVVEVAGVGLSTINSFHYDTFERKECIAGFLFCETVTYTKPVPQFTPYGDGTVVATSALAYSGESETFYFDLDELDISDEPDVQHANITESSQLQELVSSVVTEETEDIKFIYDDLENISASTQDIISVHSPVSISVESDDGSVVEKRGSEEDTEIITDIPGSRYLEFAGGKYVIVPSDIDYTVELIGMATGSYSLRVDELSESGEQTNRYTLAAATTTPQMQAEFSKTENEFSVVSTDYDGDGETDAETTIDGEAVADEPTYTVTALKQAVQQAEIHPAALERMLLFRVKRIEKMQERAETSPASFRPVARQLQGTAHQVERMEERGRIDTESTEKILLIIDVLKNKL